MKITPLNPPTDVEREALTILQEECAEVIKEVSKILRFGWDSYHPKDPTTTNRMLFQEEVGQLQHMIWYLQFMTKSIDQWALLEASDRKEGKLFRYSGLYDELSAPSYDA
jgi:hypothetical protein